LNSFRKYWQQASKDLESNRDTNISFEKIREIVEQVLRHINIVFYRNRRLVIDLIDKLLFWECFECSIKFNNIEILVIKVDNEVWTIVDYIIVFLLNLIVVIIVFLEENIILKYLVDFAIVSKVDNN